MTMADVFYKQQLDKLKAQGLYRQMRTTCNAAGRVMQIDGAEKLVFNSNNYLALANYPAIVEAAKKGLDKWGMGTAGSRLVCGNTAAHRTLEKHLAEILHTEAALVFNSGYAANTAVLNTLADKGDVILIDKLVHASIIDGARNSKATVRVWQHNDIHKLKKLLDKANYNRAFVVTDSLFSMDGDFAPLPELVAVKHQYKNVILMLDEAHAFGCVGPHGTGLADKLGLLGEVDITIVTFSKALGCFGACVACSKDIKNYLINKARGFIFTTALPAALCEATQAAIDIAQQQPQRRTKLWENANYFRKRCVEMQLDTGNSQSYIVPIIIGNTETTVQTADMLWQKGLWVSAIRPPTVAKGTSRLRASLMSSHTRDDIDKLCRELANAKQKLRF